jgi:hypothetical protein
MKIYNKIIYDINDNIIEEDSYEYYGELTQCDAVVDTVTDVLGSDIGQLALTIAVAIYAPQLTGYLTGMGVNATLAKVIVAVGSSLVMGAVGKALAPKVDPPNFGTSLQPGVTVTSKSPTQPHRIIYGTTRVGGTLVYGQTTSDTNEFLHLVIIYAGHEVDDISSIYLNDDIVSLETLSNDSNGIPIYTPTSGDQYNGKLLIKKHLGNDDQLADANLVADVTQWTTDHKISGKTYLYVKLTFDSDVYPNGVPNISVILKGKKLYDPRATSFTASSGTVSTSNNTITLSSHGLSTFDRATYDTNSNTAIGGLSNGTTYYVIKVDANTIKLATNYTNCVAGTEINLTSVTGSTTQKFNFTTFSDNPALVIRDYLTDTRYGMSAGSSELNDSNFQSVANTCDETVTVANPAGTEKRFTCNGSFQLSQSPKIIIENLLTTMGGFMVYSNGQFKLIPATYPSPTVSLNEIYLRSGLQVNTRISKKELFNAVKGVYSEPANDYQPQNYPFLTSSAFEAEDNSERIYGTFDYPFTNSSRMCQRLSKIQLLKARQQISFSAVFNLEAFQLNVGDTVNISHARFGWSNKTFQLVNWGFQVDMSTGNLSIATEFREIASAVYDFSTGDYSTISSGKATNLPKSTSVSAPTAITLTDELVSYNDGTVIVKLVIELTEATDNFTELYEIEIKQLTDADGNAVTDDFKQIGRGARLSYEFLNVIDKASYQVRARGVNIYGVNSSTITATHTVIGLSAPPPNVENFACNIVGQDAFLSWDPVDVLDLSYYVVNFSTLTSGAEWSNSVPLVTKISRPGTSITVPARVGSYLIKAVDKLGGFSIDATIIATDIAAIGNFNAITTNTQNPEFSGTKTNVVKNTDDGISYYLTLDSTELFDSASGNFDSVTSHNFDGGTQDDNVVASGTYLFSDIPIDIGSAFTARITASITQTSTDRDRLFDNVAGLFDDQLSNFDGDAPSNCRSIIQISTSSDNVTYTAFRNFSVGDYTARYYKFQLLMQSDDLGSTPLVYALSVTVDMEDRITSESDVVSGTGTKTVTYPITYKIIPALGVTAQNMTTGDSYSITSKSTTGFQIAFTNSGASGVSRTFDYIAKGY